VPRRNFGLGRKDPAFGHARFHGRINWVEPAVFGAFFICIISLFIDWRKLKEEYEINILPDVLYRGMTQGIDSEGQVKFSSLNKDWFILSKNLQLVCSLSVCVNNNVSYNLGNFAFCKASSTRRSIFRSSYANRKTG
jgi:hypothetical protein